MGIKYDSSKYLGANFGYLTEEQLFKGIKEYYEQPNMGGEQQMMKDFQGMLPSLMYDSSVISEDFAKTLTAYRDHTDSFESIDELYKVFGANVHIEGLNDLKKNQILKNIKGLQIDGRKYF